MSTLKANAFQDTSGNSLFPARAWIKHTGTGTISIIASGRVSSITDDGIGQYTITFSSNISDANYCVTYGGQNPSSVHLMTDINDRYNTTNATGSFKVGCGENGGNGSAGRHQDAQIVAAVIMR